ncbi:Rpn family recombination-promoting nuclease/putative transposase [Candidatus Babeliales bacterium]|nr:Rpn family recombination-promoting nuclease/putative transposase [Candidatus Babeliales bacterium]MBP9844073.1 Rpn family recombination-promoting nuclease/putative transposase [Candidatus Babeliales bacterium]
MNFANPKTDFTFKRLFGNEHRKNLTLNFLNNLLNRQSSTLITDISFSDNANIPAAETEKVTYLDINCTDQAGNKFIIEMQVAKEAAFLQRSQYYAAFGLSNQLKKGDFYNKLKPVIFIGIMNNPLFANDTPAISHHLICETGSHRQSLHHLEFHYIELSKFHKKLDELETEMDKWLYFFKNADSLTTIPQQFAKSKDFTDAFEVVEQSLWTPAELQSYHRSLDALNRDFRLQEGIFEEGLAKGIKKKTEDFALKLLAKGTSLSEIAELTDLTIEQIQALQEK